jgi:hypothetical protein
MKGGYWERAEAKTISMRCISRLEKAQCGTHHGRQWREIAGVMKPALESTVEEGKGMGRKRRARRSSPSGKMKTRSTRKRR